MATFSINIEPITPAWYTEMYYLFRWEDKCPANIVSGEYTVGFSPQGVDFSDTYVFSNVINGTDDRLLKITNMWATHPDSFWMEYNGIKIPNGTFEPDEPQVVIDIEHVPTGNPIPGLKFVFLNHDTDIGANISFQASVRKNSGTEGFWVYSRYSSENISCEPPPPPEVFQNTYSATDCSTTANVRVEPPTGLTRWIKITSNDSFGPTAWQGPVTGVQNFDLTILGKAGDYITFSSVTLAVYLSSTSNTIIDSYTLARPHIGVLC
jgi:hypothetical protein